MLSLQESGSLLVLVYSGIWPCVDYCNQLYKSEFVKGVLCRFDLFDIWLCCERLNCINMCFISKHRIVCVQFYNCIGTQLH